MAKLTNITASVELIMPATGQPLTDADVLAAIIDAAKNGRWLHVCNVRVSYIREGDES